jgi:hypothetical protein
MEHTTKVGGTIDWASEIVTLRLDSLASNVI